MVTHVERIAQILEAYIPLVCKSWEKGKSVIGQIHKAYERPLDSESLVLEISFIHVESPYEANESHIYQSN